MTDRKYPSPGFWITLALVAVLVGYPLSFGPVCWIASRHDPDNRLFVGTYRPLVRLYSACPWPIQKPLRRFVEFWLPPGTDFIAFDNWFFYFEE